jgi:hypothetical protein
VICWPSCLVYYTGEGIQTTNGEKKLKLIELFAIDGFGCKFLAVCTVGLKSGDGHILRSYSQIRGLLGPYVWLMTRARGVKSETVEDS